MVIAGGIAALRGPRSVDSKPVRKRFPLDRQIPLPSRLVVRLPFMDLRELESFYDAFAPAGYAFALQLTQDPEAAQDLVQSVFLRLARRPRFTILNPRSFVLRCIYRAHVDVVRRDTTRRQMLEKFAWEAQIVSEPVGLHPLTVTIKVLLKRYFWDRPSSSLLQAEPPL